MLVCEGRSGERNMGLELVPWPPNLVGALTEVADGLEADGVRVGQRRDAPSSAKAATEIWPEATQGELTGLVEYVLSIRPWSFPAQ